MKFNKRIKKALKKNKGIRLNPSEVVELAEAMGIQNPVVSVDSGPTTDVVSEELAKPIISQLGDINVHIRWMIRRDMKEVQVIENVSFDFPWLEEDFLRCLRQRNCIGMVAEYDERVVGFMIYELNKDEIHVLDFAVHPEARCETVGTQMVGKLKGKLSVKGRNKITLETRESNLPALMFFKAMGFIAKELVSDWFDDIDEDAIRMQFNHKSESLA